MLVRYRRRVEDLRSDYRSRARNYGIGADVVSLLQVVAGRLPHRGESPPSPRRLRRPAPVSHTDLTNIR